MTADSRVNALSSRVVLGALLLISQGLAMSAFAQWPDVPAPQATPIFQSRALDETTTITRFAFGSCYKAQKPGEEVWQSIAEAGPQFFVFAGDTLYPDSDDESPELPQLRAAYRMLADAPAFAKFREQTPVFAVWDDHDYGRNDGGADFPWRRQSEQLFEDAWTAESDVRRTRAGVYFSKTLGQPGKRLQLIVLDTRFFRSPLRPSDRYGAKGKERYVFDASADKTLMGSEQWTWLETQLQQDADLRVIVSSIQVLADGHGWEGWKQLPRERERLFALLRQYDTAPVLFLSGDRHVAGFYERDIGLLNPLTEFTSSALNNPISIPNRYNTLAEEGPYRKGELYGDANFGSLDIDWKAGIAELNLHGADGRIVRSLLKPLGY
ncbi:alkaline phosphatase D family protein [Congregibacter litoralis]|uniref:Phosphodiesterase/alkaline phosphatase D n=1 Tax=Congregibacter litoralis KT71 TaxID=314285 RepID=A4ACF6_9GAMM|nr:alkaline phosphatase D family protein [Congregibacter litoralis]EAQ96384.1 Phosphodiesterase/alkaline phosphatase D [Congregibacter litoralis KT71]